jgi:predicted RNase H-like nuclease
MSRRCSPSHNPDLTALIGIDGCAGGWMAAIDSGSGQTTIRRFPTLSAILDTFAAATVAIDIPIGLPVAGTRLCDQQARRLLGPLRGSSVFPAPVRAVIGATTYREVCEAWSVVDGRRCSKQLFNILPRILESDRIMTPDRQSAVFESHPEVCLLYMNGQRPLESKHTRAGRNQRIRLLRRHFRDVDRNLLRYPALAIDILDAYACLWTARRIARQADERLPAGTTQRDPRGLRMEIVT